MSLRIFDAGVAVKLIGLVFALLLSPRVSGVLIQRPFTKEQAESFASTRVHGICSLTVFEPDMVNRGTGFYVGIDRLTGLAMVVTAAHVLGPDAKADKIEIQCSGEEKAFARFYAIRPKISLPYLH